GAPIRIIGRHRTVGLQWAQWRALLLSHFGETFAVDEFQEAWGRHFWVLAETRLSLKVGALELLDTLDHFRLPRAIATSSSRRTVERHLTAHNLMGRFEEIVGHGDYERGKPAPDPFLKTAERLGGSRIMRNRQRCMLPPDGAEIPASRIFRINAPCTGSGFSRRIDRVVAIISNRFGNSSDMSSSRSNNK